MTDTGLPKIAAAFEPELIEIPFGRIIAGKTLPATAQASRKFQIIVETMLRAGMVEPPVVARMKDGSGNFLLLDGHVRFGVLKANGSERVTCLVATDDEAFTYNKRNSPVATVQEHRMILRAIEKGVSEQWLAEMMKVDIGTIRRKMHLLDGIAPEVAEMLKDKRCPVASFQILRKMKPARQIGVAALMVSMNSYSSGFVQTMLDATKPADLLVQPKPKGLSPEQVERMQMEMADLQSRIREIETSYGAENLKLVLASGYIASLMENPHVRRFLDQRHKEIFTEFRRIAEQRSRQTAIQAAG